MTSTWDTHVSSQMTSTWDTHVFSQDFGRQKPVHLVIEGHHFSTISAAPPEPMPISSVSVHTDWSAPQSPAQESSSSIPPHLEVYVVKKNGLKVFEHFDSLVANHLYVINLEILRMAFLRKEKCYGQSLRGSDGTCRVSADTQFARCSTKCFSTHQCRVSTNYISTYQCRVMPTDWKIQPEIRNVSMDKYHLSSAPMPELQWLSW